MPALLPPRHPGESIRAGSFPTAVFEVHSGSAIGRREAHLDLGGRVPPGVVPAEDDSIRRLTRRHAANLELLAIGEALVEPTPRSGLQHDLVGAVSAVRKVRTFERPPLADAIGEQPECFWK